MGKHTILDAAKYFIGRISFRVFLWSISMTDEQYWNAIYLQERNHDTSWKDLRDSGGILK